MGEMREAGTERRGTMESSEFEYDVNHSIHTHDTHDVPGTHHTHNFGKFGKFGSLGRKQSKAPSGYDDHSHYDISLHTSYDDPDYAGKKHGNSLEPPHSPNKE